MESGICFDRKCNLRLSFFFISFQWMVHVVLKQKISEFLDLREEQYFVSSNDFCVIVHAFFIHFPRFGVKDCSNLAMF